MCLIAVLWICAGGGVASAQEKIAPDVFLKQATGQTLTFTDQKTGFIVGVEQFLRPDLSVWAQSDGRCSYGHIEVRGELMCFLYEDFPNPNNCWMPFEKDGELMVLSSDSFDIQRITEINKRPVICEGAPLS